MIGNAPIGAVPIAAIAQGSSGGSPLGVAAITEGADVAAGVGTDEVFGVAGITEGADVVAGVGTDEVFGIAALTEGADVAAGVGADEVFGVAGIAEGADIVDGVGDSGATPTTNLIVKWTPFKFACRLRCLQRVTLNVGNTQQNIANLYALAVTEADTPTTNWARWRTGVNSPHIMSNLMLNVPLVPGYIASPGEYGDPPGMYGDPPAPSGGFFGKMFKQVWSWVRGLI